MRKKTQWTKKELEWMVHMLEGDVPTPENMAKWTKDRFNPDPGTVIRNGQNVFFWDGKTWINMGAWRGLGATGSNEIDLEPKKEKNLQGCRKGETVCLCKKCPLWLGKPLCRTYRELYGMESVRIPKSEVKNYKITKPPNPATFEKILTEKFEEALEKKKPKGRLV